MLWLVLGCTKQVPPRVVPTDSDLSIETIDDRDQASRWFDRRLTVFGIEIVAAPETPDAKLRHAGSIAAGYLDNDRDGLADDPDVAASLSRHRATLVMFATFEDLESSTVWDHGWLDGRIGQDLAAEETLPTHGFDASLEEVLHLVHNGGHALVYPARFDMKRSTLTEAMDKARGGHFDRVPSAYPDDAWFHYEDRTCDYPCMATEYAYWAQTTLLGAQADRCAEIAHEWGPCTSDALRQRDPLVTDLLENQVPYPMRVLPTGRYPD